MFDFDREAICLRLVFNILFSNGRFGQELAIH